MQEEILDRFHEEIERRSVSMKATHEIFGPIVNVRTIFKQNAFELNNAVKRLVGIYDEIEPAGLKEEIKYLH